MATLAPTPRRRGRGVELGALGDAFDRLASGHLTIVIVEGEAGIGKTRLLADALATHLGARGSVTVSSDPGLQNQAVDAFVELIESLALHGPLVVGLDGLQ